MEDRKKHAGMEEKSKKLAREMIDTGTSSSPSCHEERRRFQEEVLVKLGSKITKGEDRTEAALEVDIVVAMKMNDQ